MEEKVLSIRVFSKSGLCVFDESYCVVKIINNVLIVDYKVKSQIDGQSATIEKTYVKPFDEISNLQIVRNTILD